VRVGLIGTGFGTAVHMPAMRAHSAIEVVAVCSAQRARAEAAASQWGIPFATDDYLELIARDDVELVNICTPPDSHAAITIAALQAGKHVLCEKPLSLDPTEAAAMEKAVEEARTHRPGIVDAVHHELRYLPFRRTVNDLLRAGFVGDVRYVSATSIFNFGVDPGAEPYWYTWVSDKSRGGGFLTGVFSHELDLMRYTFGDLYEVSGNVSIAITEKPVLAWDYRDGDAIGADSPTNGTRKADADDTAVVTGRLENGAPFVLAGTWAVHNGSGSRLEIYGSEGTIVVHNGAITAAKRNEPLEPISPPAEYAPTAAGPAATPIAALLFADLAAVVDGRRPLEEALFARISDAARVQEAIERVRVNGERPLT